MPYALDFNIFITVMTWSAIAAFALALVLSASALIARLRGVLLKRRIAALVKLWRSVFAGDARGKRISIRARDAFTILNLWNDCRRARTGERGIPEDDLLCAVHAYGLDGVAIEMARNGDAGDRIVALTFIGYTRSQRALAQAKALTKDSNGDVSLTAFRAYALIDPDGVEALALALSEHGDWRPRNIEDVLKEIGASRISLPMAAVAERASDQQILRLLRYFPLCDPDIARTSLRQQLQWRVEPGVLASSLRALKTCALPIDHDAIVPFLRHRAFFVRVAAIEALAAICTTRDRDEFLRLVGDENSWVRYRAAQVLVERYADDECGGGVRGDVADRYARDALSQVLAERSVVAQAVPVT